MTSQVTGWSQHGFPPGSEKKVLALLKPARTTSAARRSPAARPSRPISLRRSPPAAPARRTASSACVSPRQVASQSSRTCATPSAWGRADEAAAFARLHDASVDRRRQPGGVGATVMASHRLADLRDALDAPLRLVIFDEIIEADQQRAGAAAENISGSLGCAVLIVSRQPIGVAGVAFEIEGGALTMRNGRHGDGWR